ncbi:pantetheinase isoform X2 [Sphaerodactylus townsendi]|uniref:pantetheinase isoform X2 n=1 Tax=Sphaerodactylus townsendi TaxID=933632 RepID=UPI002025C6D4|nr:pantetheinase isoform X2 [Sphaerodactylus townsendi]
MSIFIIGRALAMVSFQSLLPWSFFVLMMILKSSALDKYTAAVYEHSVLLPKPTHKPVSSEEALKLMNRNMDILEEAIKRAAAQGAHIIVTPEDGIYGFQFTRETLYPYLEDIPDPQVNWIPCNDSQRFGPAPVQERLSCLARDNSIYVVANIGDKKPCDYTDPKCPNDGRYQYNTNVVFDSDGKLVARYHKFNLFMSEAQFDFPKEPEHVIFNTSFGKFGIFTCFDILFHDPAITLVSKLKVDTILFPTAWMNVLPHLTAVEFHSAWAMGMQVNLLSSNTHKIGMNMTGSGIYAPDGPQAYHYDAESENGQLLIAELHAHPSVSPTYLHAVNWSLHATTIKPFPQNNTFSGFIFSDEFTFSQLDNQAGNLTVCQKDLCCHLSYRMTEQQEDEVYALGSFDGLHVVEGEYYLQICTLLKCRSTDMRTCGQSVTAHTHFGSFSLSGTFSTNYVFPEVLLSGVQLAPEEFQVLSDGQLISQNGTSKPILTVTLFGRWYEKDPPHPEQDFIYCVQMVQTLPQQITHQTRVWKWIGPQPNLLIINTSNT